jgi:MinD-like ATPase involved in chromosome partitioning or flagellar assembly
VHTVGIFNACLLGNQYLVIGRPPGIEEEATVQTLMIEGWIVVLPPPAE